MTISKAKSIAVAVIAAGTFVAAGGAHAQEVKHYRFAHDQQIPSGYSVASLLLGTPASGFAGINAASTTTLD